MTALREKLEHLHNESCCLQQLAFDQSKHATDRMEKKILSQSHPSSLSPLQDNPTALEILG